MAKPLTGRKVLIMLLAFFGTVVAVNLTMMKLAIDSMPGTEVDSAYRASTAYNAEISAAARQDTRRWRVAGHLDRAADGHAKVKVEARDSAGAPLGGLAFSARLARPTDKRADRLIALTEQETGIYRGELGDVAPGQWDLVLEAERGAERLFLSRNRLVLK